MAEIDLSDVTPECREKFTKELSKLFKDLENLKIIATKDFENKVTEYLQKRGVTLPYKSTRSGGEVVAAKTLHYPLTDQQLGTCLILTANMAVFATCGRGWEKIERIHILLHERAHIIQGQEKYRQIGHAKFFADPLSTAECIGELSDDIICEYMAERNSIETIKTCYTSDSSQYFLSKLKGLVEIIVKHLNTFEEDLAREILRFRKGLTSIDDLWKHVYLRTRDTLNALSLATAYIHMYPAFSSTFTDIGSNATYKKLFENTWIEVEQTFVFLRSGKSSHDESVKKTTGLFLNLFKTLGIRVCDINGRLAVFL